MGLEVATYISDLVTTNPVAGDVVSQGDDHLRTIKTTLQNTFPGADRAMPFPDTESKTANFSIVAGDFNKTFLVDASGVASRLDMTLPSLTSGDKGWKCHFVKTDTSTKPTRVLPASGTLQSGDISGLSATRRCIPGVLFTAHWTGTLWFITRCLDVPVGTCLEYDVDSLPVGFEWPNGQTLASSTLYPDYNSKNGGLTTIDKRGCVAMAKDNLGGSAASRVAAGNTSFGSGNNPNTLGVIGGDDNTTMSAANLIEHDHDITDKSHVHTVQAIEEVANSQNPATRYLAQVSQIYRNSGTFVNMGTDMIKPTFTGITSTENAGSATPTPMSRIQPTVVKNFILVVE